MQPYENTIFTSPIEMLIAKTRNEETRPLVTKPTETEFEARQTADIMNFLQSELEAAYQQSLKDVESPDLMGFYCQTCKLSFTFVRGQENQPCEHLRKILQARLVPPNPSTSKSDLPAPESPVTGQMSGRLATSPTASGKISRPSATPMGSTRRARGAASGSVSTEPT